MSEVAFIAKVTALHVTYDSQGNEYVTIDFAYRPPKMPTMMSTDVPKEVSDMIKATREMMTSMVPQQTYLRDYANRLVLFLTTDEFERLEQKYTVGDELKVTIKPDGSITAIRA
jgi:hypothetical protein